MNILRPPTRLPFRPARLVADAVNTTKPGDSARPPRWMGAVSLVPPFQPHQAGGCPAAWGVFGTANGQQQQQSAPSTALQPDGPILRWRGAKGKAARYARPPRITFAEDGLRRAFFRQHPFELTRPKLLSETAWGARAAELDYRHGLLGRPLPTRSPRGTSATSDSPRLHPADLNVDAEHVVHYTLYLCSAQGGRMCKADAYAQALREFYAIRQQQGKLLHELALKRQAAEAAEAARAGPPPTSFRSHPNPRAVEERAFLASHPHTRRFVQLEGEALERHSEAFPDSGAHRR